MKKTFKTLLSFLIIITLAASVFTFNVSAASATISGAGEYEVGKSFNVTVRFNADATLYAVEASVSYNSSVLRLDSVSGAEYNAGNGTVKIVDDGFTATKPSKTSSYTLKFTAIAAGNSPISVSILGGGEAESSASASAAVTVVTPTPSSNANLASIKLSDGSLSPAFNANTTSYSATVKYSVENITISAAVADGGATYSGGGTFALQVGDNSRTITVTAADGTKKSYTVNIKRMTEAETEKTEQDARDANPLLVIINDIDLYIVNDLSGITVPAGFTQGTATRKDSEIAVLNDEKGNYVLYWLADESGENGAFYTRDEDDNFTKLVYINANGKMYIVEDLGVTDALPTGYKLTTQTINGTEVDAIGYENEQLKDFYILNCYADGKTEYYRYDTLQGTMQRAAEFDLAVLSADTAVTEEPADISEWFKNMNTTGKTIFAIIVIAALALVVLAILVIVKIATSKHEDDFYEGEAMQSTANDFILNDFASEDIHEEAPQQAVAEEVPEDVSEEISDKTSNSDEESADSPTSDEQED